MTAPFSTQVIQQNTQVIQQKLPTLDISISKGIMYRDLGCKIVGRTEIFKKRVCYPEVDNFRKCLPSMMKHALVWHSCHRKASLCSAPSKALFLAALFTSTGGFSLTTHPKNVMARKPGKYNFWDYSICHTGQRYWGPVRWNAQKNLSSWRNLIYCGENWSKQMGARSSLTPKASTYEHPYSHLQFLSFCSGTTTLAKILGHLLCRYSHQPPSSFGECPSLIFRKLSTGSFTTL